MDEQKFHAGAMWVGSIVFGILLEAVLLQVARRCMPGLFHNQQPQQNPRLKR